ncbi:MAG: DoxX family protein [Proteobacteria bacterium]|nr:DoxX family protein [Pseudomonadota bacterium]
MPFEKWYFKFTYFSQAYGMPILLFLIRLWMAKVFFYSGLTKISDWSNTLFLFKEEYAVPLLSPELSAMLATACELSMPVLLVVGFASRLACIPLLIMVVVIEFTYTSNVEHVYWVFLLLIILLYGPGCLSIDHWIRKKWLS